MLSCCCGCYCCCGCCCGCCCCCCCGFTGTPEPPCFSQIVFNPARGAEPTATPGMLNEIFADARAIAATPERNWSRGVCGLRVLFLPVLVALPLVSSSEALLFIFSQGSSELVSSTSELAIAMQLLKERWHTVTAKGTLDSAAPSLGLQWLLRMCKCIIHPHPKL